MKVSLTLMRALMVMVMFCVSTEEVDQTKKPNKLELNVVIPLTRKTYKVKINGSDLIAQLKQKVADVTGNQALTAIIQRSGKTLAPRLTVEEAGLKNHDTIEAIWLFGNM